MSSFYVTTPIYYVNAAPHLGHAYTTIATDVMARHHRQRGEDVFFLTGTDEHGEPVADAAKAQGLDPKDLADRNAERFQALMPRLEVSNDFFIRTSDDGHKRRVQEVLQRVHDNGHVYMGTYEGWYCPRCADFKVENEILEGNRCPIHEIELVREQEDNWFFRLSGFQAELERLYADRTDFVMPRERYNEALAFIESGLQDIPMSRGRLTWGVEVPWDPSHVFYVWFDALLNYYTALGYARDGEDLTARFWPATFHIIGKDILRFHTVFWPAMLMAADLPLPRHVFVHGFLLGGDGRKMSKSLGNVLDPFEVMDRWGTEALRFYLLRDVTFGADGATSMEAVQARYEGELANELGNLASRTIAMIARYRDGDVAAGEPDPVIAGEFEGLVATVSAQVDRAELTPALEEIWRRVRRLNRYVEEQAPWALAKDEARAADLDRVLRTLAQGLRVVAVLLWPWLPASVEKLLAALGAEDLLLERAGLGQARVGPVTKLEPLFPKQS
jgi:methionyl-tRNA synthetase